MYNSNLIKYNNGFNIIQSNNNHVHNFCNKNFKWLLLQYRNDKIVAIITVEIRQILKLLNSTTSTGYI